MPRSNRGVSHSDTEGMMSFSRLESRLDPDIETNMPPITRRRLHTLFGKIEKEFETIYDQNAQLRQQIEVLNDKLEQATGKNNRDHSDYSDGSKQPKKAEKSANQISQKLKNTYKSHTSRIVSSFRPQSSSCHVKRDFRGHRDGVWEVNVSKIDRQIIGTASADQTCRLWWVHNGSCLLHYTGHKGSVNSVRFHPSQDLVLTASGDTTAHIWRAQINKPLTSDTSKAHSSEDEVEISERDDPEEADDSRKEYQTVRQPIIELAGHTGVVIAADWLRDGSQVITSSWDRTANLFDVETGDIISTFQGHDQELTNVCAHANQNLAVTTGKDTTFRLWDLRDPYMKVNVFQGHTQSVTSAAFVGSDKVVSGSDDNTCKVWDLKNMRSPITTIRTDSAINRLSVHPVHHKIAIPQDNRHIRIYDINGDRVMRLPRSSRQGHSRMVCSVAWGWNERDAASTTTGGACSLYSCAFDRQVLAWNINMHSKD